MNLTARDLMQTDMKTVSPDLPLPELEQRFLEDRVGGYPVLEGDHLVGIVSRADILRRLCAERSAAEHVSDYYHVVGDGSAPVESLESFAQRFGTRTEGLRVRDVMVRLMITVEPDHTIRHVARTIVDNHIHRVLVTSERRLVGIISSIDLVRLVADGQTGNTSP